VKLRLIFPLSVGLSKVKTSEMKIRKNSGRLEEIKTKDKQKRYVNRWL